MRSRLRADNRDTPHNVVLQAGACIHSTRRGLSCIPSYAAPSPTPTNESCQMLSIIPRPSHRLTQLPEYQNNQDRAPQRRVSPLPPCKLPLPHLSHEMQLRWVHTLGRFRSRNPHNPHSGRRPPLIDWSAEQAGLGVAYGTTGTYCRACKPKNYHKIGLLHLCEAKGQNCQTVWIIHITIHSVDSHPHIHMHVGCTTASPARSLARSGRIGFG